MRKILEYIIRAKDATATGINSAINRIRGFRAAVSDMDGFAKSVKSAVPVMALMNNAMGESNGVMAKTIRVISSVASAFMVFGPGGAIVAVVKAGMDVVANYFIKKADEMLEKAKELGARMTERLDKLKELKFDSLTRELEGVAKKTEKAISLFDMLADAREKSLGAKTRNATAEGSLKIAGMREQMAKDVAAAGEDREDQVAAAWRVAIAKEELKIAEDIATREDYADKVAMEAAKARLALTEKTVKELEEAAQKAEKMAEQMKDTFSETDPAYVKKYEEAAKKARDRVTAAKDSADAQRGDIAAAKINQEAAEKERQAKIKAAKTAVIEEQKAREKADKDRSRKEEQRRKEIERKIAEETRRLKIQEEQKELRKQQKAYSDAQSRYSDAQGKVSSARQNFERADTIEGRREMRKEERREAKLERRYDHRLANLQKKYGEKWREATGLSTSERATRNLAIAKEEEANAKAEMERAAAAAEKCEQHLEKLVENIDSGGE